MKAMAWLVLAGFCAGVAQAEDITIFRASTAGVDAWSWGGAKVKAQGGDLAVIESNPDASYGDAFVADRFPYLPDGIIELNVAAVDSGTFTLQVLGFKGEAHAYTAEPVKDVAQPGSFKVTLRNTELAADTDTILLKMWVGGAEGATTKLRELSYQVAVNTADAQLDERFKDVARWKPDEGKITIAAEPAGGVLTLQGSASFASVELPERLDRQAGRILLAQAPAANGIFTVQLNVFDAGGNFLGAVDAIKDAGPGWHGASLDSVSWPEGAAAYSVKIWLGGSAGASVTLARLIIGPP